MSQQHRPNTPEERLDTVLGNLLRIGVILSFAVIICGVVLLFVQHPDYLTDPAARATLMGSAAVFPYTPGKLGEGLLNMEGRAVITLGVLLLIVTPVARIVGSVIGFWLQGDRVYGLMTLTVLIVLVVSFFLGLHV